LKNYCRLKKYCGLGSANGPTHRQMTQSTAGLSSRNSPKLAAEFCNSAAPMDERTIHLTRPQRNAHP